MWEGLASTLLSEDLTLPGILVHSWQAQACGGLGLGECTCHLN